MTNTVTAQTLAAIITSLKLMERTLEVKCQCENCYRMRLIVKNALKASGNVSQ